MSAYLSAVEWRDGVEMDIQPAITRLRSMNSEVPSILNGKLRSNIC